jgi:hypothetical protein
MRSLLLSFSPILLSALAFGQISTLSGTQLTVDGGTSLRIDAPGTWGIQSGASVVNDGIITLGPLADLNESPGGAITGTGTEQTTRTFNGPLVAEDPAGLGAMITTNSALGTTQVVRGHIPRVDYSGHSSIARWIDLSPANNAGLNATLDFRYDVQELNGLLEPSQVLHVESGGGVWDFLSSTVNTGARTVTSSGLDSLGTFTTFDQNLPNAVADRIRQTGYTLVGNAGGAPLLWVPAGERVARAEIISTLGAVVLAWSPNWSEGLHELPAFAASSGMYRLRVNGTRVFNFLRP